MIALTFGRMVIGLLVLLIARMLLEMGTWLSRVGWWLGDREDMIAEQRRAIAVVRGVMGDKT